MSKLPAPTELVARLLVVVLLAGCGRAGGVAQDPAPAPVVVAAAAEPELVAIDLFGTRQITLEQVMAKYGKQLRAFGEASMRESLEVDTDAVVARLYELGDFAEITPALVGYYEPGGMKYYLTLDFVDRRDAARRMPFLAAPAGAYEDPDGLLADWRAYEAKVHELMGARQMAAARVACPAFHCMGDSTHADVKELADRFAARVPAHFDELAAILRDDQDDGHRAAAAYLLAYSADGPAVVKLMISAFRDGNSLVRNNAMRVIADIAYYHPELAVPFEPVLEALDYPATTDRNKAGAILAGLLDQPGASAAHRLVATRAGVTLLAMLRLEQPNNHDFAYRILKAISGKTFGERDYAAWESWLLSQR